MYSSDPDNLLKNMTDYQIGDDPNPDEDKVVNDCCVVKTNDEIYDILNPPQSPGDTCGPGLILNENITSGEQFKIQLVLMH